MNTRIDLGNAGVLVIECKQPYVVGLAGEPVWGARQALAIFNGEAMRVRGPVQPTTGEAMGIAARLAQRYKPDQFDRLAYIFWQRYSDPVYNGDPTHAMRLFAAILPQIERDLNHA